MSRKSHGSPLIADYLTNWTSSFFLEGESDSQFLDVRDVSVFTGIVVDICQDASWYQKKTRKNIFSCSIQCTMVWEHTTSGQEKLRQHFGPITWAKTGTVAYWKQENIWFYLRPSSSKASFSSLKLTTSLKIKCCKKCFFGFICYFSRLQKWY